MVKICFANEVMDYVCLGFADEVRSSGSVVSVLLGPKISPKRFLFLVVALMASKNFGFTSTMPVLIGISLLFSHCDLLLVLLCVFGIAKWISSALRD